MITKHGPYDGVSGWFDVNGSASVADAADGGQRDQQRAATDSAARTRRRRTSDQTSAANSLCALGAANGIDCAVVAQPGKHDWPFADHAFAAALPWLAGQIGTPGVPAVAVAPIRPTTTDRTGGRQVTRSVVGFGDRREYRWRCA